MFRGNAPARIDDKGRLKVPNAFRSLLEGKYGRELFLTSLTGEYVRVYPMPVWLDIEQKLAGMPSVHPSKLRFLDRVNYFGQVGGARRAGPRADSGPPARCRHDVGRRRRARPGQLSRRLESRSLPDAVCSVNRTPTTTRERSRSSGFDGPHSRADRRSAAATCSPSAAACSSTAPSVSAAMPARCSKPAPRGSSASIAIRPPLPRRATTWRRGPIAWSSSTRTIARSTKCSTAAASTRSTARWPTSASPRCSSRPKAAASASSATSRSTCAWIRPRARRAADLVARSSERDLADAIFKYGEERFSRRIARSIVEARHDAPIATTGRLAVDRPAVGPAPRLHADRSRDAYVPGAAHLGEPRARGPRPLHRDGRAAAPDWPRGWS